MKKARLGLQSRRAVSKDVASIQQTEQWRMRRAGYAVGAMLAALMAFVALCEWGAL